MIKKASDRRRQSIKEELDDAARANSDEATENALARIENLLRKKFSRKIREEDAVGILDNEVIEVSENAVKDPVETDDK